MNTTSKPGVSAMSAYVPPFRVRLQDWCQWTGNSWDKIQVVVGRSFRVPGRHENVYTMASNAVLRLILQNQIDPQRVGFLGLGTESSTDNAAGAVIVRGMVDHALDGLRMPRLSRNCEVPEFKHACLGGVYALKNALRYVNYDGRDRQAIVVSADVAEYERGSSGEQTQGAGAVAMLVERTPRLFGVPGLQPAIDVMVLAVIGLAFCLERARGTGPGFACRSTQPSERTLSQEVAR